MAKYYFHPNIKYSTFKKVKTKLYKGTGPSIQPMHIDQILWELLRDRKINIFIDTSRKSDPVGFTLKSIPKNAKVISDGKKDFKVFYGDTKGGVIFNS